MMSETGQQLSRDSHDVVRLLPDDTFVARRSSDFVPAIMSFPKDDG
jgi:hypothetical protein